MKRLVAALVAAAALAGAASAEVTPLAPSYISVSPDGTQIAWVEGFSSKIWVSRPDGSAAHVVARAPTGEGISDLQWTARGLVVDSNFTLYLVRPGERARLISGTNGGFDFASGGTRVATGLERAPGVYVVTDIVTGRQWRYGSPKVENHYGALSPDGERVAWSRPGGIWVARLGRTAHRLAAAAACPSWSPDGRSIAFLRFPDLRVIPANGGRSRLLAARAGGCQQTVWSPGSSTIAFAGPRGVILVGVRTAKLRRLPRALGETFYPAWARDGSALYVSSRPPRDAGANCLDIARVDTATLRWAVVVRGCP